MVNFRPMKSALISIIIPVYNTESTLARCVDSALSQTYPNCEIVIVDDGTPDSAGAIADGYASRFDNVSVVHKTNAGLAEARRSGVMEAKGEYVIHLDSDDELLPEAVLFLYEKIRNQDLDIAYGSYIRIDEKGVENIVPFKNDVVMNGEEFLKYNIELNARCASWGSLSRRSLWLNDIYPPADMKLPSEDVLINIKLSQYATRVGLFNKPVCRYYYNSQSLTSTGALSQVDKWNTYFKIVEENLKERGLLVKYESLLYTLKIDRLAFYVTGLDTKDSWVKSVINDNRYRLPLKHRILKALMRYPSVWEPLRSIKRKLL